MKELATKYIPPQRLFPCLPGVVLYADKIGGSLYKNLIILFAMGVESFFSRPRGLGSVAAMLRGPVQSAIHPQTNTKSLVLIPGSNFEKNT